MARVSVPSLASLKPQAWRSMCGWTGKGSSAACPIRETSFWKPATVIGALRSVVNT